MPLNANRCGQLASWLNWQTSADFMHFPIGVSISQKTWLITNEPDVFSCLTHVPLLSKGNAKLEVINK